MNRKEFIIQYVLNRAKAAPTDITTVRDAVRVWNYIIDECNKEVNEQTIDNRYAPAT